jgi:hypothetical protein
MERLTRGLTWLLGRAERLLVTPGRRQWIEAVRAETEQVPAGWAQLSWLAGGLWLVFREANMARKIGYWLGVGAVAVIAAWTAWLSLRTTPASDAEAITDRFRILVGLTALVGLPWLARRHGVFGPVGPGVLARFMRIAGCGAVCGVGLLIVHLDRSSQGNGLGTGGFSPVQEFAGLAALAAAVVAPYAVRARWPQAEREKTWGVTACAAVTALVLIPLQAIPVAYLMLIMAATSRRSPVRSTTLIAGTIGGLAYFLSLFATPIVDNGFLILMIIVVPTLLCTTLGGTGAAWLMTSTGTGSTGGAEDLRAARVRQGMYAGIAAGAIGGLALALSISFFGISMALGPLVGVVGGRLGGALAADHLPKRRSRDRSVSFGLYISD